MSDVSQDHPVVVTYSDEIGAALTRLRTARSEKARLLALLMSSALAEFVERARCLHTERTTLRPNIERIPFEGIAIIDVFYVIGSGGFIVERIRLVPWDDGPPPSGTPLGLPRGAGYGFGYADTLLGDGVDGFFVNYYNRPITVIVDDDQLAAPVPAPSLGLGVDLTVLVDELPRLLNDVHYDVDGAGDDMIFGTVDNMDGVVDEHSGEDTVAGMVGGSGADSWEVSPVIVWAHADLHPGGRAGDGGGLPGDGHGGGGGRRRAHADGAAIYRYVADILQLLDGLLAGLGLAGLGGDGLLARTRADGNVGTNIGTALLHPPALPSVRREPAGERPWQVN
jgi:hypothetical protein